jgi:hypothetical protein
MNLTSKPSVPSTRIVRGLRRVLAPIALGALVPFAAGCAPAEPDLEDFWEVDLERAREVALDSGRALLVVFR